MKNIGIHLKFLIVFFTFGILEGCGNIDGILYSIDDLDGSQIAVLDHSVIDKSLNKLFPESDIVHFKSSSEFLLALAIGKCDAGIVEKQEGEYLLNRNPDYALLSYYEDLGDGTVAMIVHRRLLPGRNESVLERGILEKATDRIYRSIITDGYWKLIVKGFANTVAMFLLGIVIAFILTFIMLTMNHNSYLRYISKPVSYFIRKIHDVPSVVLIFFFYYVVFASAHVSTIFVCALSLGVYTSGSLINIFTVHLNQIDKNQHAAAQMLGLTGWKKYRYVILPQAVKPMLPLIAAEAKVMLRATTYAGYISGLDLVKVTEIIRNETYDVLVPLLMVSAVFLTLSHIIVESLSAIYNKAFKYD